MKLARKGPAYRASKKNERKLRVYGLPGRYWSFRDRHIRGITSFTTDRPWAPNEQPLTINPARQKAAIDKFFTTDALAVTSPVVAVGSEPTDELGLIFGAAIMSRALDLTHPTEGRKLRPAMINVARSPAHTEINGDPDVVVFWNVKGDSAPIRTDACRDWLARFDDCFRVLIVAGSTPAHFFYNRLHWEPDVSLYFRGEYSA